MSEFYGVNILRKSRNTTKMATGRGGKHEMSSSPIQDRGSVNQELLESH